MSEQEDHKQLVNETTSSRSAQNGDISRRRFLRNTGLTVGASLLPEIAGWDCCRKKGESIPLYDVVIIGSGISGAILAKRLAEHGRTVLILEAGDGALNDRTKETSNFLSDLNKFPESPFDPNPNAPSATIAQLLGIESSYLDHVKEENAKGETITTPFGSTYVRKTGGTMWHWMGTCLRLLPNDFRMKEKYGHGVDWPICYEDLGITGRNCEGLSYYDMAENEIGVSARVADQDPGGRFGLFRSERVYPMPALESTIVDEFFKKGVKGMKFSDDGGPDDEHGQDVWVYRTPAGRNSVPYNNRPACAGNSSCVPLCRIKAKYDATVTLDYVNRHHGDKVTIKRRCVANKLHFSTDKKQVEGVCYIPYEKASTVSPGEPKFVAGRVYVVAANGIESPKLLLHSGMGKINDHIGRNLMDHPFFLRWGLTPPDERIYPYRGPLSTGGLDGNRDGTFRKERAAYRIEIGNDGWALTAQDPANSVREFVDGAGLYGPQLVRQLNDRFTRQCRIGFELEQLPDPNNRVTLSEHRDQLGIPRPRVRYSVSDYENRGFRSALKFTKELFDRLKIEDHSREVVGDRFEFMGAGHIMGTCCMGEQGKSVVDSEQRSHDFRNLFIVGSSVFPTGGTANPTLTIAALAFWAADNIDRQLG